jgi:uncharacterized protein (DUF2147 family)
MKTSLTRSTAIAASLLGLLVLPAFSSRPAAADAPSPVGRWRTYEEDTNELRSIIEITAVDDTLEGKVLKRFPPPGDPTHGICSACKGERKGKPIVGMTILWGLKRDGDGWGGGTIIMPLTGREYSVQMHTEDGGSKLKVHGYIGTPLFGETQTWIRDQ